MKRLMTKFIVGILAAIFILPIAVRSQDQKILDAQSVVDKAIKTHGGKSYDKLKVSFTFRKMDYLINIDKGSFQYIRIKKDSLSETKDILENSGFQRFVNSNRVEVKESDSKKYTNSINSVAYFTLLPKGLNDEAVIKRKLNDIAIKGQVYHCIQVKFKEDGGGSDFQDVFLYWIHTKNYTVDYLAYSFEEDGGGIRFREAFNPQVVGKVRFQDYINYSAASKDIDMETLPKLFEQGELKKLSEILNENMKLIK